ncbi:MAG: NfeD family protein [Phycisphaerales bacterium]
MNEVMLYWGIGLLGASLLLLILEVFIPSGGLIAVTATGCAIAGVVCLFRVSTTWGLVGILGLMFLGPSAFAFALKVWPHTPIGRRMLGDRSPEELEAERRAAEREREERQALLGAEGVVVTDLRPVGVVSIDGRRHDALSEESMLRAGTRVRVSVVEPNQIKVRRA